MKKLLCMALAAACLMTAACSPVVKTNEEAVSHVKDERHFDYDASHYPVTVKTINSKGEWEEQTFTKPPERVATVWQNSVETLLALGVGDRVVASMGLPDKKYLRPEYQGQYEKIPYQSFELLGVESLMMLEPDFIVGWYSSFATKTLRSTDFWHSRGVHTYITPASAPVQDKSGPIPKPMPRTLDEEYQDILNMGAIFDKRDKAEELVNQMKDEVEYAREETKDLPVRPRAMVIEFLSKEMNLYNQRSLAGYMVQTLGGDLLLPKNDAISIEQIVEQDPDAIFVVVIESSYGNEQQVLDHVYKHPALQNLTAVKNHRVYPLPLYAIYSPGVRAYDGIKIISRGLYPELYKDEEK